MRASRPGTGRVVQSMLGCAKNARKFADRGLTSNMRETDAIEGAGHELAVVMPVFNEEACISGVVESWHDELSRNQIDFRMIILNDGSRDGTRHLLDRLEHRPGIEVIHKQNSGHGPTILMGYRKGVELGAVGLSDRQRRRDGAGPFHPILAQARGLRRDHRDSRPSTSVVFAAADQHGLAHDDQTSFRDRCPRRQRSLPPDSIILSCVGPSWNPARGRHAEHPDLRSPGSIFVARPQSHDPVRRPDNRRALREELETRGGRIEIALGGHSIPRAVPVNEGSIPFLIIGGGPTGLGAALRFQELGAPWRLLEKSSEVGGLASSYAVDGFTWDCGTHVLFSHYPRFDRLLGEILSPDEWGTYRRASHVRTCQRWVPYPFQYNIGALPPDQRQACLEGLMHLQSLGSPPDRSSFQAFIETQFGAGIASLFMLPYNRKAWAYPLDRMNTAWLGERVPPINLAKVTAAVRPAEEDSSWGPNNSFRYPLVGGTGEIWKRLAGRLPSEQISPASRSPGSLPRGERSHCGTAGFCATAG